MPPPPFLFGTNDPRAHFITLLTITNIVESTNSVWREIRELPPLQLLNGLYQWTLTTFYERQQVVLVPGNSILSNTAYQSYKHRETAARGFQIQPSSDTRFLVTTSRGSEFIVTLPDAGSLHLLTSLTQGHCSCLKYQEYIAPCEHSAGQSQVGSFSIESNRLLSCRKHLLA